MKTTIRKYIIFVLSTLVFSTAYAGDPRLSIWGAYSFGKDVSEVTGQPTKIYETAHCYRRTLTNPSYGKSAGSFGIDYRIIRGLYIGASLTTGGEFSELTNDNPEKHVEAIVSYNTTYLLFNCRFEWLKLKDFRIYSRGGLGVGFISKAKLKTDSAFEITESRGPSEKLAWHLSLAGIEYKPLRFLGVFAEGGFGNQGNMLAGIRLYPI